MSADCLGLLRDDLGEPVQGGLRHAAIGVVARGQQELRAARTSTWGVRIFVCEAYHDDKESLRQASARRPALPENQLN